MKSKSFFKHADPSCFALPPRSRKLTAKALAGLEAPGSGNNTPRTDFSQQPKAEQDISESQTPLKLRASSPISISSTTSSVVAMEEEGSHVDKHFSKEEILELENLRLKHELELERRRLSMMSKKLTKRR